MPFKNFSSTDYFMFGGLFSSFLGSLSYYLKTQEGKPFKMGEFVAHTLASGAFGWLAYELLVVAGFSPEFCAISCGWAGWMGTRFARIIEVSFRKKTGVTKEDLQ